jgi:hypothetical protein
LSRPFDLGVLTFAARYRDLRAPRPGWTPSLIEELIADGDSRARDLLQLALRFDRLRVGLGIRIPRTRPPKPATQPEPIEARYRALLQAVLDPERDRRPPNERTFRETASAHGWRTRKSGWPDYICLGPAWRAFVVNVLPRDKYGIIERLNLYETEALEVLRQIGIGCWVFDGEVLARYNKDEHGGDSRKPRRSHYRRRYKIGEYTKLEKLAVANGWYACRSGWPDFLCSGPDGRVMAVEVKRRTRSGTLDPLERAQTAVMAALSAKGLKCYVSDGQRLERFDIYVHGANGLRASRLEPQTMMQSDIGDDRRGRS